MYTRTQELHFISKHIYYLLEEGIAVMTICLSICVFLAGLHKYYCLDLPDKSMKMRLGPT